MKWAMLAAAAWVAGVGCDYEFQNPHLEVRGLTEEDLKAPPGKREIKAAVINDIRDRRVLASRLDEGHRAVPPEISLDKYGVEAVRVKDNYELWRITVRQDPVDKVFSVTETAYWDNEQYMYYYHYEGGTPHRDVWMGPFLVKFAKPPEDTEHIGH